MSALGIGKTPICKKLENKKEGGPSVKVALDLLVLRKSLKRSTLFWAEPWGPVSLSAVASLAHSRRMLFTSSLLVTVYFLSQNCSDPETGRC
jgi:hypothetical protein